jgi:hypothetical protein
LKRSKPATHRTTVSVLFPTKPFLQGDKASAAVVVTLEVVHLSILSSFSVETVKTATIKTVVALLNFSTMTVTVLVYVRYHRLFPSFYLDLDLIGCWNSFLRSR